ncbi:putative deacetylase LmbE-like domain-containing protein [Aspergillus keveii]|uniref:N-acetylglucosaminylphosphatidylinositol deacetylase n=1 Tax=Aspergillus keveii TaxID=714993 RepID=A0ABR4FVU1_9EURO
MPCLLLLVSIKPSILIRMKPSLTLGILLSAYVTPALCQILNIVAHQDDDLLFLSPDLLHYIQSGHKVRTIFLTAGDSGMNANYWQGRERGARAAYALMSDAPDIWTEKDAGIPGHEAPLFTLNQDPNVSLVFLRLPDGHLQGQGFDVTGNESLQKLWEGVIPSIRTISGSSSYTKDELLKALISLMVDFGPERVNTLDYVHPYGDGDHSDHHSAAFFVAEAVKSYETNPMLMGYMGYPVINETANIAGTDLLEKQLAFYAYARGDPAVCNSHMACQGDQYYPRWLEREYRLDGGPVSNAGSPQVAGLNALVTLDGSLSSDPKHLPLTYEWVQVSGTPMDLMNADTNHPSFMTPNEPDTLNFELIVTNGGIKSAPAPVTVTTMRHPENIALKAKVTASSANTAANQTPDKAIDASTGGFPAEHTREWVSIGGKTGSWLTLSWESSPQVVSKIALYDRPNLDDQITGGVIEFDSGERIDIGELNNYGTATSFDVEDRTVRSLTIRITAVSPSTMNVGLSEVQVFGSSVS